MSTQPTPSPLKASPWPRWTVGRAALLLLAILAPLVHLGFWTGHGGLIFSGFMLAFGLLWVSLPIALLALAVVYVYSCWVQSGPRLRWRIGIGVLQFGWLLLLLGLLLFTGKCVEDASLYVTQKRAKEAMAALEVFRVHYGHYPESVADIEEDMGKPFPRPTVADQFDYAPRQNGYDFGFESQSSSLHGHWRFDLKAKRWQIE